MSLELKAVQVRLPDEAMEALRLLADVGDKELGEVARELLTDCLLGKAHSVKLLADRLSRATKRDSERK